MRVTKEVVIAEFEPGGKMHPVHAAFQAIGKDYADDGADGFARYAFPGPDAGSTVHVDVGLESGSRDAA